jgi:prophage tail gpP-like protein
MPDAIPLPPVNPNPPPGGFQAPPAVELPTVVRRPVLPAEPKRLDADAATRAAITVNGVEYKDWESVYVRCEYNSSYDYFRFSSAERDPIPQADWTKWQIKPGDACTVTLAGQQVINGYVESRQVAYNATAHGIQIIGKGKPVWASKSSIASKDGNFDGMSVEEVARKVLAPFGTPLKTIGLLNPRPFEKLQSNPGELTFDFIDRIARPRGIQIGTTPNGEFLLIGRRKLGEVQIQGELIEGTNIKAMQCVIDLQHNYSDINVTAQAQGSDDQSGTAASELFCSVKGDAPFKSLLEIPAEQPVKSQEEVCERALFEAQWQLATKITAIVTVQGWLYDGINLWRAGQFVFVQSPMAMLELVLGAQAVTYTQDNENGTQTELEMVLPEKINGDSTINFEKPSPQPVPSVSRG